MFLVGAPVFKTGEGEHLVLAGSIPVRLRHASLASIFTKLDLTQEPDDHRRVLAVLAWLDG